jgi:aspartokinase-like uncharacterized kinase
MSASSLRVIKVGGSLLEAPDLPDRLFTWLENLPPARCVMLAGGGGMADELRRLDKLRPLGEAAAHWAAISIMDVTAWMLAAWMQEFDITSDYAALTDRLYDAEDPIIFAPARFLREVEPKLMGTRLARSWEVTSDSIAVRLATILVANEVILVKSAPPKFAHDFTNNGMLRVSGANLEELALSGYVDTYLPRLVGEAPPICVCPLPQT